MQNHVRVAQLDGHGHPRTALTLAPKIERVPHYGASGGRPFWSDFQHFQKRCNSADGAIFPCTLVICPPLDYAHKYITARWAEAWGGVSKALVADKESLGHCWECSKGHDRSIIIAP